MFKFRRRQRNNNPADPDDDEPMRGTSFKNKNRGGAAPPSRFDRQPRPYGGGTQQQKQQRGSPKLGRPNNNKHPSARPNTYNNNNAKRGEISSKVSYSDTCSETVQTDTWTAEYERSEGSSDQDDNSNSSGSGHDLGESGEFSNNSGSFSDHDEQGSADGGPSMEWGHPNNAGLGAMPFTDEEASYESVGGNVVHVDNVKLQQKSGKSNKPPPPPRRRGGDGMNDSSISIGDSSAHGHNGQQGGNGRKKRSNSLSSRGSKSRRNKKGEQDHPTAQSSSKSVGNNDNHAPQQQQQQHGEQSMKLKPPSMKGMPSNNGKFNYRKRASTSSTGGGESAASTPQQQAASSAATPATAASSATSVGNTTTPEGGENTQGAAMQQLAFLVVSLRSDLRESNLRRDELETELSDSEKKNASGSDKANPYSDDAQLQQLEKENADLQSDVDCFIAEQDDLKGEVRGLREEKKVLNDVIARLKVDVNQSGGGVSSSSVAAGSLTSSKGPKSMADLEERVQDLTDENRKLEKEIQLLVGEKSQLVSSSDVQKCEMQQLEKSLAEQALEMNEKTRMVGGMQEKIDSLESAYDELERECKDGKMEVAVLEDELQIKGEEVEAALREFQSGGTKMTLLRQRLSQVEKQKGELSDRNEALDSVMLTLKKKMEEVLQERNATKSEMESLKSDNERMSIKLKTHSSKAIAAQATEADTLLNLQKMISSLEECMSQLEEEIDHKDEQLKFNCVKISQLESKVRMHEEQEELIKGYEVKIAGLESKLRVQKELSSQSLDGEVLDGMQESEFLKECIVDLTAENEGMTCKLEELQNQLSELEDLKQDSAKTVHDLSASIESNQEGYDTLMSTKSNLESQNQVSMDTIANLQKMFAQLEESKVELEDEMHEATDAIAMLEDELDCKDAQVKELLMKLTMLQQQFSQVDKCKTALAERNAKLSSQNDDLGTEVKIHMIEKKVASEEIETLKTMKSIADEDEEEELFIKNEQKQEIDELHDRLEENRTKSNDTVLALEQQVYQLEESNRKLEENLDESSDAIAMLREALEELEEGKNSKDEQIRELVSTAESLKNIESDKIKLQSEHQVSVNTISALQKMISSLEDSKEDLEEELNASSLALHDIKDQLKFKNTMSEVLVLENKLKRAEDSNTTLTKRIADLTEDNQKMKDEVKDLGRNLANVTATRRHAEASVQVNSSLALVPSDPVLSSDLLSSDPVVACDVLISELRNQIKAVVSARNAALEEVEILRCDASILSSEVTIPPARAAETKQAAEYVTESSLSSPSDDSTKTEQPSEDEKSVKTKKSVTSSYAGSRGSSLLEAAKKLCNQLDEKRSMEETEKLSSNNNTAPSAAATNKNKQATAMPREEELIKNVVDQDDDNVSAREVKEESPKETTEKSDAKAKSSSSPTLEDKKKEDARKKKEDSNRASRSKPRLDIDQLTSIYFEKCGMSVSRFSDLSSESSSFRRRTVKAPSDTVTKKVKICRNGVFMGTFEGDLNAEGQRHGFGVLLCDNGNSYEGEWKKDKRDGLGIARYSSGDVYDGQWQRGKREGHGVMYIEAGDTYIGSWNNGLKHGAGTYHWADGEVDVSWYQEDRRVGEGVRWNSSRSTAFQLIRGTKKEELSLDEAYMTAEKLGLNLEKFSSGVP
mmetsp:Transcript_9663/g.21781  ORF Transcript_9663/g.21781 Transcript_9663/m.21781 type:complete len:1646 (+) Transcript_9663:125-5062(+)|eukprot:CAMPEP_0172297090 /NCGR_PEP_ID=MMETSP1058-20130122/241_1 /TAXON_ID=83371 /ORGANISM="Detonula confervacea, Strain CCMP 353" /LENGTH=1645 /DNA_ID=CAMNT_0013006197 /DNA_START=40 /DNA_END=4977 /DNA_ORIENTATION=-